MPAASTCYERRNRDRPPAKSSPSQAETIAAWSPCSTMQASACRPHSPQQPMPASASIKTQPHTDAGTFRLQLYPSPSKANRQFRSAASLSPRASPRICRLHTTNPSPSGSPAASRSSKMTRAIERLVERHDALRASFDETGRIMKIYPRLNIPMPVTDLSSTQSRAANQAGRAFASSSSTRRRCPFPLPAGTALPLPDDLAWQRFRRGHPHCAPCHLRRLVAGCPHSRSLRPLLRRTLIKPCAPPPTPRVFSRTCRA